MSHQLSRRFAVFGLSKLPRCVYKGPDLDGNTSSTILRRNSITHQALNPSQALVTRASELQCFHRSFSTSKILNNDIYRGTKEIYTNRVTGGKRIYFIDLKYDISGNPNREALLVKLVEKTLNKNRKSMIMINFCDFNKFIHHLKQGFDPDSYEKVSTCYASYQTSLIQKEYVSKEFENRKYEFFAQENDNGKFLKLVELRGANQEAKSHILVAHEYLPLLVDGCEQVLKFGESYVEDYIEKMSKKIT